MNIFRMCMDCQRPLVNNAEGKAIAEPGSEPMTDRDKWPPNVSHGLCLECLNKRLAEMGKPTESFQEWLKRKKHE